MKDAIHARTLLVSGIASGQGKTTLTAALARKLVRQGKRVRVFKAGPDFLDPMMLERASGAPVYNLDLWMVGTEACRAMLARASRLADVILIEGVMGLYDGTPSSADLANALGIPVLLTLDASAMAQTAAALVLGLRDYGPVRLAGVIANRVGHPAHAQMIADGLRGVPLLGYLPPQGRSLPERHLGIHQPDEVADLDAMLDSLAEALVLLQELDLASERSTAAVEQEPVPMRFPAEDGTSKGTNKDTSAIPLALQGRRIAVARDAAFAFLYRANLDCLEAMGAELVYFSPLANESLPENSDALYLPGGYPELHAQRLSDNLCWQSSLRAAHSAGMPIYAECGGMMALADTLTNADGTAWPMAGLLPGNAIMQKHLAAIGLQAWHGRAGTLRGHAFHYSRLLTTLLPHARTLRHPSGTEGESIFRNGSLTASYFHAYFPSCPDAIARIFTGAEL
jgi:cobyrinic acid a,c-diamide synthase